MTETWSILVSLKVSSPSPKELGGAEGIEYFRVKFPSKAGAQVKNAH